MTRRHTFEARKKRKKI